MPAVESVQFKLVGADSAEPPLLKNRRDRCQNRTPYYRSYLLSPPLACISLCWPSFGDPSSSSNHTLPQPEHAASSAVTFRDKQDIESFEERIRSTDLLSVCHYQDWQSEKESIAPSGNSTARHCDSIGCRLRARLRLRTTRPSWTKLVIPPTRHSLFFAVFICTLRRIRNS
ncbi:hypothetical protein C8F01DRAFT_52460 [Mycena amicta]|nr:hypothetical protein C8F01DRAFT_52460 [Mycena amicta]